MHPRVFAIVSTIAIFVLGLFTGQSPAGADSSGWQWPLPAGRDVARHFEPPATDYAAGHRGVDLPGEIGDQVSAVASGTVGFVGSIAGVRIVVIDHGGTESTYQPVLASVRTGQRIGAGEPIGSLTAQGSHCASRPCLHLGRKVGEQYADPLELMHGISRIQLTDPRGEPPAPPFALGGTGTLQMPVNGSVTSRFGMRVHPITGVHKLHDGTDFGASCGTPVRAAAAGVVRNRSFNAGYGNRLFLEHSGGMETSYNHLGRYAVSVGTRVAAGDTVGLVGSTGYSTGCHLHFMVTMGGRAVNPEPLL